MNELCPRRYGRFGVDIWWAVFFMCIQCDHGAIKSQWNGLGLKVKSTGYSYLKHVSIKQGHNRLNGEI